MKLWRIAVAALLLSLGTQSYVFAEIRVGNAMFSPEREGLQLRGKGIATWMRFIDVYAAALYAPADAPPAEALSGRYPLHLEVEYFVDLPREDIIRAAETALQRQFSTPQLADMAEQLDDLHASYRDVAQGQRYAITFRPGEGLRLCHSEFGCSPLQGDDRFALAYLAIWLGERPLSATLRQQLLDWG